MAVVGQANAIDDSMGATKASDGTIEYRAVYIVVVDDAQDGPAVVLTATGLPSLGSTYKLGNDADTTATLRRLEPRRESRLTWHVFASWSNELNDPEEAPTDSQGNPTSDPTEERISIDISYLPLFEDVQEGRYVGPPAGRKGFVGLAGAKRPINYEGPIVNSAFDPIDGVQREGARLVIRLTRNELDFDGNLYQRYNNVLNDDLVAIDHPEIGFSMNFGAGALLMKPPQTRNLQRTLTSSGGSRIVGYWRTTFEMHVGVFNPVFVDKGVQARALEGDPDGFGGTVAGGITKGQGWRRVILDPFGIPVVAPVPLDGDGQPLGEHEDEHLMRWEVYKRLAFGPLGL